MNHEEQARFAGKSDRCIDCHSPNLLIDDNEHFCCQSCGAKRKSCTSLEPRERIGERSMRTAKELAEIILDNRRLEIAIDVIRQARAEALEEAADIAVEHTCDIPSVLCHCGGEIAKSIRAISNE